MIVVGDNSPIITLAAVGELRLLSELFHEVLISEAVHREIVEQGRGRSGAGEVQAAGWIGRSTVTDSALAGVLEMELDEGEAEAIALALERGADLVLLDERRARQRAGTLGLRVTGVLGVLVDAKRRERLAEVRPVLDRLLTGAGFWISEALYRRTLELSGEAAP